MGHHDEDKLMENQSLQAADQPPGFEKYVPVELDKRDRFQRYKPNDFWATILFILHLVVSIVYMGLTYLIEPESGKPNLYYFNSQDVITISTTVLISFVFGGIVAVIYLVVSIKMPKMMIKLSALAYVSFMMAIVIMGTIICLASGYYFLGIILGIEILLFAIFGLLLFLMIKKAAALTAVYIQIATEILREFKAVLLISFLGLILYCIFTFFLYACFLLSFRYFNYQYGAAIFFPGMFWLVFSWYWTTQVIKGIVRVTIAGIVGRWYFNDDVKDQGAIIFKSFFRATFTSSGSICFGSLIVAIIATLKTTFRFLYTLNASTSAQNLAMCFVKIFVGCFLFCFYSMFLRLEAALRFFNRYAFTYIGIYGFPFIKAGRATLGLLITKGLEVVLTDVAISIVLATQILGVVMGAIFISTGSVTFFYYFIYTEDYLNEMELIYYVSNFLSVFFAVGIALITTELIAYIIPSVLICSSEEPSRMTGKTPALVEILHKKYPQLALLREINIHV